MVNGFTAEGKTLPEAFHEAIFKMARFSEFCPCPDYNTNTKECSNVTIVVDEPLTEPRISRMVICGPRELQQYEMEVLDGILNFRIGKGWSYTYNSRIAPQLEFIVEELKRNPWSRRAVVDVRDWQYDAENDSPACLQHIQYMIRGGKLHCYVLFRSNDFLNATYMNMWALIRLQEKIAGLLGVPVGCYCHRVNSMHIYEKDWKRLEDYVLSIMHRKPEELTYHYEQQFKSMMEESIPGIMEMVEQLKES